MAGNFPSNNPEGFNPSRTTPLGQPNRPLGPGYGGFDPSFEMGALRGFGDALDYRSLVPRPGQHAGVARSELAGRGPGEAGFPGVSGALPSMTGEQGGDPMQAGVSGGPGHGGGHGSYMPHPSAGLGAGAGMHGGGMDDQALAFMRMRNSMAMGAFGNPGFDPGVLGNPYGMMGYDPHRQMGMGAGFGGYGMYPQLIGGGMGPPGMGAMGLGGGAGLMGAMGAHMGAPYDSPGGLAHVGGAQQALQGRLLAQSQLLGRGGLALDKLPADLPSAAAAHVGGPAPAAAAAAPADAKLGAAGVPDPLPPAAGGVDPRLPAPLKSTSSARSSAQPGRSGARGGRAAAGKAATDRQGAASRSGKREREDEGAPAAAAAAPRATKEDESAMSGDSHNVVLRRLRQNRESARKSRERKKNYKEQLLKKIPQLKKQQEEMSASLDVMLKSVQDSVMQVLSPTMQDVVTKQSQYYDQCSALAGLMGGQASEPVETALKRIDVLWRSLLQAQKEATVNTADAFTMLAGKHMQPSHRLWLWMGGIRVSVVLRTFLGIRANIVSADTRSQLLRHVECWHIQEEVLDRGKSMWTECLVACCIAIIQSRKAHPGPVTQAPLPLSVPGKLDALSVLLADAVQMRGNCMATLRRLLSDRQMCLLLIVQVSLLESMSMLTSWSPKMPTPSKVTPAAFNLLNWGQPEGLPGAELLGSALPK